MCLILIRLPEGSVQVCKDAKFVRTMEKGALFGELAILHHCERTATVRGTSACPSKFSVTLGMLLFFKQYISEYLTSTLGKSAIPRENDHPPILLSSFAACTFPTNL